MSGMNNISFLRRVLKYGNAFWVANLQIKMLFVKSIIDSLFFKKELVDLLD